MINNQNTLIIMKYSKYFLAILFICSSTSILSAQSDAFYRRAKNAEKNHQHSYAVFFSALTLQSSNNKKQIIETKAILNRNYQKYVDSVEAKIALLEESFTSAKGDTAVNNRELVYKMYKDLLRNMNNIEVISSVQLSAQSKDDIDLEIKTENYLDKKIKVKKQVLLTRELAMAEYYNQGVKVAQVKDIKNKLRGLELLDLALKYNLRDREIKISYREIMGQIATLYSAQAVELLKEENIKSSESALIKLDSAAQYAKDDAQLEDILSRIDITKEYIAKQKVKLLYQEGTRLAQSNNLEDQKLALSTFEEILTLDSLYQDTKSQIQSIRKQVTLNYLNQAEELFNTNDIAKAASALELLDLARDVDPLNTSTLAFIKNKQESINILKSLLLDKRDNKTYPTIKIGKAIWTAKNFAFPLSDMQNCYPDALSDKIIDKQSFCEQYGRIYNSQKVVEKLEEFVPKGWHVATYDDWENALEIFGGSGSELLDSLNVKFFAYPEFQAGKEVTSKALFATSTLVDKPEGGQAMRIFSLNIDGLVEKVHDARGAKWVFVRCVKNSVK